MNHFAIDVLPVVIRYATRRGNQRGLHNVRFAVKDAQTFLAAYVGDGSVAEVHLYHPQPYHDPRQAHRRVITPRFLADVHRALQPSGLFVIQTDNPDYWNYMTRVIPHFFELQDQEGPWPDAPEGRSRREIIARQRGLRIFRGLATRRDDLDRDAALDLAGSLPEPRFRSHGPWCELDRWEEGQIDEAGPAPLRTLPEKPPTARAAHGSSRARRGPSPVAGGPLQVAILHQVTDGTPGGKMDLSELFLDRIEVLITR